MSFLLISSLKRLVGTQPKDTRINRRQTGIDKFIGNLIIVFLFKRGKFIKYSGRIPAWHAEVINREDIDFKRNQGVF